MLCCRFARRFLLPVAASSGLELKVFPLRPSRPSSRPSPSSSSSSVVVRWMKLVTAAPVSLAILLSFVVVVCSLIGSSRTGEATQRPTELHMQMGGSHSNEKAQASQPAVHRDVRSHAPGHGGPAFAHAPDDAPAANSGGPAAAVSSRPGGISSAGLTFNTKAFDYFVGLKGIDTDAGDLLPTDDQEGKAWIDLRRQQRDRKPLQTRIIRPGEVVTMDYVGSRLNVHLNEQSIITSVTMG